LTLKKTQHKLFLVKSIPKASTPSSDEEDFKEIGGGSGQVNSEDEMEEK